MVTNNNKRKTPSVLCNRFWFYFVEKLLKQEGIQLKIASGSPRNWTDSPGLLPDKAVKGAKKEFQTQPAPWRIRNCWAAWKRFRSTQTPGNDTLQPVELPEGWAVSSRFLAFVSCLTGWGGLWWYSCLWDISFTLCSLLSILYVIPIKLNGSPGWILVVICTLVSCGFPICGE